ncbi:unnamed protein product [Pleuronectes platessa]|uniref:Uncharacterized protein n=1 Tax=Pleuronectes platessa TaxID=8262 RepID=A0A9N7UY04_PLEPL|nr:unnamed protein product [Pleuronectes platessa]
MRSWPPGLGPFSSYGGRPRGGGFRPPGLRFRKPPGERDRDLKGAGPSAPSQGPARKGGGNLKGEWDLDRERL